MISGGGPENPWFRCKSLGESNPDFRVRVCGPKRGLLLFDFLFYNQRNLWTFPVSQQTLKNYSTPFFAFFQIIISQIILFRCFPNRLR